MGDRKLAQSKIEKALTRSFPEPRSAAVKRLVNDLHALTAKNHLDSGELATLAAIVDHTKAIIDEAQIST